MNVTSAADSSSPLLLFLGKNVTAFTVEAWDDSDLFHSTSTTVTTTTTTTITTTLLTTTTSTFVRLFNTTRTFPSPRTTTSPLLNEYFLFKTTFNRVLRIVELFILSLALPLYAIVLILFIELNAQRTSSNTTISGGGTRSRSQRRRQRMRSLIWTSNYLLVDFLGLLYELIYVIIHLTGDLALSSFAGRFYCQSQVYVPLYLTVLMAYSLTAISIYRRRHFVSLHRQTTRSTRWSMFTVGALWIAAFVTAIVPAFLLAHFGFLKITHNEGTNQCQFSYTYGSTIEVVYTFYRLANIFLLPLSISSACYLTICVDLIRMQQRFSRAFKRHVHIRQNLIHQILFLFLNFAVFWLPAEIITLYTKSRVLKDTVQVTKSFNILLDPIIITGFDTRFSSAAQQLLTKWRLDEFMCFLGASRQTSGSSSLQPTLTRTGTSRRLGPTTLRRHPPAKLKRTPTHTWNMAEDDDITVLESVSNHLTTVVDERQKKSPQSSVRQQQRRRRQPQRTASMANNRQRLSPNRVIKTGNHVTASAV